MKTIFIFSFIISFSAQAWVNEVFFIRGKIRAYDKNMVQIETETENVAHVPRSAIPDKFNITGLSAVVAVPVYSNRTADIKWRASKKLRIVKFNDEQDEILKELEAEYQRALKARRTR